MADAAGSVSPLRCGVRGRPSPRSCGWDSDSSRGQLRASGTVNQLHAWLDFDAATLTLATMLWWLDVDWGEINQRFLFKRWSSSEIG